MITALQLDTKLDGIPASVLAERAQQAQGPDDHPGRDARGDHRAGRDVSYAPRIITIKVPVDKIGEVIGPRAR